MQPALLPPGAPGQVGLVTQRCANILPKRSVYFALNQQLDYQTRDETHSSVLQPEKRRHRIRKTEGSSPDYTGVSPWRNSLSGGSISAVLRCQLTSAPGSRTLFANNQTQACNEQLLDPTGPLAGTINAPSYLSRGRDSIYQEDNISNLVTLLLSTDKNPGSVGLTQMPWFSGGCHIGFHFPPSGCRRNTFQGMHVPGACFCYLAEYSSFQLVSEAPGRVRRSCIIQGLRDHLVQRRSLAGIWVWGRLEELCSAELWFMHVGALTWSLEPPRSEIRPNSVSLGALIPAVQSRTADRTFRLRYQALACSAGLSPLS